MAFVHLIQNQLRYISYGIILIFIASCSIDYKALRQAIIAVDKSAVEQILDKLPSDKLKIIINQTDERGYTVLSYCSDRHIMSNLKNNAEANDYLSILKHLLGHPSCDVHILDKDSKNLLHWAIINNYVGAVKLILGESPAIQNGQVKKLTEHRDKFGYAPLHYLVWDDSMIYSQKHAAILQQYLDHPSCNVNIRDSEYFPELYWLIHYKQPELIKQLLKSDTCEDFRSLVIQNFYELDDNIIMKPDSAWQYSVKLRASLNKILEETCAFLRDKTIDQDVKRLLLTKYFRVNKPPQDIKEPSDIIDLRLGVEVKT